MPLEAYVVTAVFGPIPTRKAGTDQYQIALSAVAADVHDTIVTTLKPWAASLCERARVTHQRVSIGWRETRYGPELITCTLLSNPPQTIADVEAAGYLADPIFSAEAK